MEEKENFDTGEKEEAPIEEKAPTDETPADEKSPTEEAAEGETPDDEPSEKQEEKSDKKKPKKKLSGKPKKDPRDEQIAELTDKVKRQLAEFENFRTRSEKEKQQRYDMGASFVIERILPVLDNFERGLEAAPEGDAFAEGMQMIYKQLLTALEEIGVKPIEALGQEFNPEYHNAVMQSEATDEYPSGTVSQEMQKGYTYHDAVVRHSMVAVAQ